MANDTTDAQKQERQKTVVAFVAGLLIGGLLVWIFSSSTAAPGPQQDTGDNDNTGVAVENDSTAGSDTEADDAMNGDTGSSNGNGSAVPSSGEGGLSVGNQAAGTAVTLASVEYPTTEGWIVVRDYVNGESGGILGAARYNTTVGLLPTSVELLRATEAGSQYEVTFYTENGDLVFDLAGDVEMPGMEVYFTAR